MPASNDSEPFGPIPVANRPGHHPATEQDKPVGPPPGPPQTGSFGFEFHPLFRVPALAVGVTHRTARVELTSDTVSVRFGPWYLQVDRNEIVEASRSGPYRPWKVIGPPHLSLSDGGITFATTPREGVCLRLRTSVPGIEPTGRLRHRGVTVTVADADGLVEALS